MKKKIDARIRTLIENGVAEKHRSLFVLVGDRGKDQVRQLGPARWLFTVCVCAWKAQLLRQSHHDN